MIQVLVPSRLESPEYRAQRDEIELRIARINGRFGQPGSTPVEYINRDISKPALVALYRRADVMMVTALRDGMNLVAHEFVLCQSEPGLPGRWRGSLLLSELAGAAQVLPGALLVNPWDVEGVVEHLGTALGQTARQRQRRLETMAKRVHDLDTRRLDRILVDLPAGTSTGMISVPTRNTIPVSACTATTRDIGTGPEPFPTSATTTTRRPGPSSWSADRSAAVIRARYSESSDSSLASTDSTSAGTSPSACQRASGPRVAGR